MGVVDLKHIINNKWPQCHIVQNDSLSPEKQSRQLQDIKSMKLPDWVDSYAMQKEKPPSISLSVATQQQLQVIRSQHAIAKCI